MKFLCTLLLLFSVKCFGQYPFEKHLPKKYDSVSFKNIEANDSNHVFVAKYKNYKIKLLDTRLKDSSNLLLYFKGRLIKKAKCNSDFFSTYLLPSLYISDIDDDGRIDFKFITWNVGATGLGGSRAYVFYLFNKGNNRFSLISYADFFFYRQFQFDSDGRYEIVGQTLVNYQGHHYWLFDLYNYNDGKLINVSKKYGYPIAVSYLYNETFKPTNKIPKKDLERLSLKLPEFYDSN